jgi:hypothetical protein
MLGVLSGLVDVVVQSLPQTQEEGLLFQDLAF